MRHDMQIEQQERGVDITPTLRYPAHSFRARRAPGSTTGVGTTVPQGRHGRTCDEAIAAPKPVQERSEVRRAMSVKRSMLLRANPAGTIQHPASRLPLRYQRPRRSVYACLPKTRMSGTTASLSCGAGVKYIPTWGTANRRTPGQLEPSDHVPSCPAIIGSTDTADPSRNDRAITSDR